MQALLLFCLCFGVLAVDGQGLKNDLDSLIALLPETDVSSSQHQPVDSSSASSE